MALIVSRISVAEAATIINGAITFAQFTLSLSLVILLVFFMPKTNTALSWSSISRTLHSSHWPTILRTDSNSKRTASISVSVISHMTAIIAILFAIVGVTLPLGLHDGPLLPSNFQPVAAKYISDGSPLARATSPNRQSFQYGRFCGVFDLLPCPDNPNNPNTTTYAPSTITKFNSTSHGPFSMQFRRFFNGGALNLSKGLLGTSQSLILRDDTFVVDGLIVDMSLDNPGIGFWNQTVPNLADGGTWTQDVLWLEPVTECVNTNLTLDYFLMDGPDAIIQSYNITDRGGIVGLTHENPSLDRNGQRIDLRQHAFKGAVFSNFFAMQFLNTTRESSVDGKAYPLNDSFSSGLTGNKANKVVPLPLSYLNSSAAASTNILCRGFGGQDTANITNVQVTCGAVLGPPLRADGGDLRVLEVGSMWSQAIHVCASTTRASVQRVVLSTNDTSLLQNIQVSRQRSNLTVLWGVEKTDMKIADVDLLWGRVGDGFENDPSLWTMRADSLYLPASGSGIDGVALPQGQPLSAHGVAWGGVYGVLPKDTLTDYTGSSDFAMKSKFQDIVRQNPVAGPAQIRNAIWTDIMTNNVIGTPTSSTLLVARNLKSIEYDLRFAIPGMVLFLIWVLATFGAIILLATRTFTFDYMRNVLNHTSVGRVVVGNSVLRVQGQVPGSSYNMLNLKPSLSSMTNPSSRSFVDLGTSGNASGHRREKSDWADTTGNTRVVLGLDRKNSYSDEGNLIP